MADSDSAVEDDEIDWDPDEERALRKQARALREQEEGEERPRKSIAERRAAYAAWRNAKRKVGLYRAWRQETAAQDESGASSGQSDDGDDADDESYGSHSLSGSEHPGGEVAETDYDVIVVGAGRRACSWRWIWGVSRCRSCWSRRLWPTHRRILWAARTSIARPWKPSVGEASWR